MTLLNLGAFEPITHAMGPGSRACIWVKGCSLNCPGCATPEYIPSTPGEMLSINEMFERVLRARDEYGLEGISFSGGEPFEQAVLLTELVRRIRETELSVLSWSGYTRAFLESDRAPVGSRDFLGSLDVLIDGPFIRKRVQDDIPLRGSSNQTLHLLTDRYSISDFEDAGVEAVIGPDGNVIMSGVVDIGAAKAVLELFGVT